MLHCKVLKFWSNETFSWACMGKTSIKRWKILNERREKNMNLVSVGPSSASLRIGVRIWRCWKIVSLYRWFRSRRWFHRIRIMSKLDRFIVVDLASSCGRFWSGIAQSIHQSSHSRTTAASTAAPYRARCYWIVTRFV